MNRNKFLKQISPILILPLLVIKSQSKKEYGIGFECSMGENMQEAIIDQIPYYDEIPQNKNINDIEILWKTLTIQEYYDEHDYNAIRDEEFLRDKKGKLLKIVRTDVIDFTRRFKYKYNPDEHILYCEIQILI